MAESWCFFMTIKNITRNNKIISIVSSDNILLKDIQSALNLISMVSQDNQFYKLIVIDKKNVDEELFVLSNGRLGEILQKFINYNIKIAIYGDYSKYTSKPLQDFIYESNKGKDIFFADSLEDAIKKLSN